MKRRYFVAVTLPSGDLKWFIVTASTPLKAEMAAYCHRGVDPRSGVECHDDLDVPSSPEFDRDFVNIVTD